MFNKLQIASLDDYLDRNVSFQYQQQPLAQDWARMSKMAEEVGEAIQAFIGTTGQNPRKGFHGSADDVDNELVDVALTAILCLQHRTKNVDVTCNVISERMAYRMNKAGLCNHEEDDGCMWCCSTCNTDRHLCPGCGTPTDHKNSVCDECKEM